ncbi:unnamed protein product [Oppiella nova]|uniref:Uncharacterized protein n=1 Tax=Oppiella nova TaxID=334625 RepID=A0A7R9QUP1_9ACAR|nr:unnamed protein product [Oppiella nova]CAG2175656.1 unnamed protein product [Oppiella nova]
MSLWTQEGEDAVWSHPIDVHYACRGLSGWPKVHFQVWHQDIHGRNDIIHQSPPERQSKCISVETANRAPSSHLFNLYAAFFIGGGPRLKVEETVYNCGDRFRLQTRAAGTVHIQTLHAMVYDTGETGTSCKSRHDPESSCACCMT